MIDETIAFNLPVPWASGSFETNSVGPINYLVGPNGSGKSRFAWSLLQHLKSKRARFLGTDRLKEMADPGRAVSAHWGDTFRTGYAKSSFQVLKNVGAEGSGVDTIMMLEERLDLRIRIEATLSHLFGRDVKLEWDSGNLVPKAVRRESGESYRLDREECHGIKELLVLLTHLYDKQKNYLIVDEPELNLHPQYQAFFMQEVRKVAGDPSSDASKKIVFLITHSPFILDLRLEDDLKSIISFDLKYSLPKQVGRASPEVCSAMIGSGRLNVYHKQLFFSDNPVFVEGIHDALMVETLMEARGVSSAAAGSCIVESGGVGEVNHYLKLCQELGKEAHFVYDLDSLFRGQLRRRVNEDDTIQNLMACAGVGTQFAGYVGDLDKLLTNVIDSLLEAATLGDVLPSLDRLFHEFGKAARKNWEKDQLSRARVAVMTAISTNGDDVDSIVQGQAVQDIRGRWQRVLSTLAEKNIHVLPGGSIERYLPTFAGDVLDPTPDAKKNAILAEVKEVQRIRVSEGLGSEAALTARYGELYEIVKKLPSKAEVDIKGTLRSHLSDYVHELQKVVNSNPGWGRQRIQQHMNASPMQQSGVVTIDSFQRISNGRFDATIRLPDILGDDPHFLDVDSDTTIENMGDIRS